MKEHGILFSAPMVKALLAGRKSQTRRMSKQWLKVKAGDVLWVRESFCICQGPAYGSGQSDPAVVYAADGKDEALKYKPSIHMPRWASRISLIAAEDAREQELWDIKAWECVSEGIEGDIGNAVPNFARLWDELHGKDAPWASNPTVVRLAFRDSRIPEFNSGRPVAVKSIP